MKSLVNKKTLLGICLALIALNHAEMYVRTHRDKPDDKSEPAVKAAKPEGGHRTISVDEASVDDEGELFLRFSTLMAWDYDPDEDTPPPEPIADLNGDKVVMIGFMYPLQPDTQNVDVFSLGRTTQTCCFGPSPDYNEFALVEMDHKVDYERLKPMRVHGRIYVEARPEDGYIYRVEGTRIEPATEQRAEIDPEEVTDRADLPTFRFDPLEKIQKAIESGKKSRIPDALKRLHSKKVVLSGYIVGGRGRNLLIGRNFWDRCCTGIPPDKFNSVSLHLKPEETPPPLWQERGTFIGTLKLTPTSNRVVTIVEAVAADTLLNVVLAEPLIPLSVEVFAGLGLFGVNAWPWLRRRYLQGHLASGRGHVQEQAFAGLVGMIDTGDDVGNVERVLGSPHRVYSDHEGFICGDAASRASEVWAYAMDEVQDAQFLGRADLPEETSDPFSLRQGRCGACIGLKDRRVVAVRTWNARSG